MSLSYAEINSKIRHRMNTNAEVDFLSGKEHAPEIYKLETSTIIVEALTFDDLLDKIDNSVFPDDSQLISVYSGGIAASTTASPIPWAVFRIYSGL